VTKVTVEAVPLRPSAALTVVKEDTTMTMTNEPVQIVTVTPSTADVRLRSAGKAVSIGRVQSSNGRWCWQHRDGEQSSAVAVSRSDAAEALVQMDDYSWRKHALPRQLRCLSRMALIALNGEARGGQIQRN